MSHSQVARGQAVTEARVTVTFDLEVSEAAPAGESEVAVAEWQVTRKLRVTKQGTYTSNYFINGEPCTLTELHEQLNRLRIYPEATMSCCRGMSPALFP